MQVINKRVYLQRNNAQLINIKMEQTLKKLSHLARAKTTANKKKLIIALIVSLIAIISKIIAGESLTDDVTAFINQLVEMLNTLKNGN